MVSQVVPETINLFGGALCLDFANTIDWHDDGTPLGTDTDALFEPAALARWGRRLGLLDDGVGVTRAELAAARALRAALHATFSAIAEGRPPPADALARLAHDHAEAAAAGRLTPHHCDAPGSLRSDADAAASHHTRAAATDSAPCLPDAERPTGSEASRPKADSAASTPDPDRGGAWRLDWPRGDARRVRFAAATDALALLRDPDRLARVRVCPGRHCGWLFYDTSGRRRWCSMQVCGSREKMRRLYARRRR